MFIGISKSVLRVRRNELSDIDVAVCHCVLHSRHKSADGRYLLLKGLAVDELGGDYSPVIFSVGHIDIDIEATADCPRHAVYVL